MIFAVLIKRFLQRREIDASCISFIDYQNKPITFTPFTFIWVPKIKPLEVNISWN